jgi:ABC-type Zn2+ transport system substrate-binding protein/surface adhesin
MNLATHVRIVLGEYNRRGVQFDEAWVYAMRSLPKGKNAIEKARLAEWKPILLWAKPHFRASFTHCDSDGSQQPDDQHDHDHEHEGVHEERDGVRLATL